MLTEQAKLLESFILITTNTKFPKIPATEEEFMEIANDLREKFYIEDEEFDKIVKSLKANLMISMDIGVYISDENSDFQSWLPSRSADIDFFYWNRYKKYLEMEKRWNKRVTSNMDVISSEIVDLLGDPKSENPWQRRGLVLGDVQSGKTANYTAICNKAADTGYKVIIVLTGMMENLRKQTQERLDKEFAGRQSKDLLRKKKSGEVRNVFDGVGKIDPTKRISAFTSVLYDFNSTILNSNDLTLRNITEPALFVVKKNKSVLKNLESWLTANNADHNGKIDLPLLLIDDEADNASVNTKNEDQDPTAINQAIRSILSRFYKASYIGITATPFANIFINPETPHEMLGDDLFPKDYIYVLSPPSNYIGADKLFGDPPTFSSSLIEIDEEEINSFFPFNHKKELTVDDLPSDLYEALGYFLLSNAIRDHRLDTHDHRSMLVNVSRFTDVQVGIKDQCIVWLNQVKSDVRNYAALKESAALEIATIKYLRGVWDKYNLEMVSGITWLELQQKYLHKAISPIEVRAVNQKTGAASLDYSNYKETGFRVIAIGGISLSRGLTLEGLCVSYFYRNSQMYDTLLQMGRWFGYRPNYEDLFKIWMAKDAIDWYGFITSASNELKDEISQMNKDSLTPKDFGLKVRQDPNSLIVTAKNKMRAATWVSRPIQVSGRLLETPRLKTKKEVLSANEKAFKVFINKLRNNQKSETHMNGHFWKGVSKNEVVNLLRSFDTHPWHLAFQGTAIAEYIESNNSIDKWDVFLPNGSGKDYTLNTSDGEIKINKQERTITESNGMIKISGTKVRVGSGGVTRAGLSLKEIKSIDKNYKDEYPNKNNIPDRVYLSVKREPLLMLHVLDKKEESSDAKVPPTVYAIGIGLPGNGELKTANYMVNNVELRNWMDIEEDEEEEDAN